MLAHVPIMEGPADEVFLKNVAAAQFGLDVIKVKEHSWLPSGVRHDRLQAARADAAQTHPEDLQRPTPPWMKLAGFYVLISRVRTIEGPRVLYRDEQGLAHQRTLQWKPQLRAWVQGFDDQGRWSDKRAAAAKKTVCAAQAILRDRRKAEVNAQKREVKAKAKAKPTPTRKSKATRKAGAKGGANGKASAGQTASMSGIDV